MSEIPRKTNTSSGFWTGGPPAYSDALRAEYQAKLADLKQRLRCCETYGERQSIEEEIRRAKREWREKLAGMDRGLF